jgi:hypothetical protein
MKRIALLAVIGAGLMALPGTAAAQLGSVNCPSGLQISASQICVHVAGAGGELVVNNADSCTYINGWSTNPFYVGYAGICTQATPDPTCNGTGQGSGANEGGCFWIKSAPAAVNEALQNPVTVTLICGNLEGENPRHTGRDGCFLPDLDFGLR